ncbi:hypothetical protein K443DRAFT_8630 [Laccaria amethystina LaAM-08-1]|uniref:Unplaced genomic scaffold K443scaffold_118, whole genome shotgun sequence n=1 Tax=Laccaria amethystina LaAM-08-1 TaxID=1095629 RepID=A0A0C9XT87_9AGAR|nr:hypothetical protein K443DRAFT_8630 [Laccaria amethystina LaAM-08-1]
MRRVGHRQNPSSRLSPSEPLQIRVRYRSDWGIPSTFKADIHHDDVVKAAQPQSSSKRGTCYTFSNRFSFADFNLSTPEWSQTYPKFQVVLVLTISSHAESELSGPAFPTRTDRELQPTTDAIFKLVDRFRVLVVGNTGVGKSSLINECFGVNLANVEHHKAGVSDINKEIIADENGRFVLHDSQGFEPGEGENFQKVITFLQARKGMMEVRDQVHAIWLCFPVPLSSSDRLFEAGVEELFSKKACGEFGPVPLITIFTKYDMLVEEVEFGNNLEFHERNKHLDPKTRNARLAEETRAKFQELCVRPFEEEVGTNIPHISVSTSEEYTGTRKMLKELVHRTAVYVKNSLAVDVAEDVALVSAIAQRVNPVVKIDAVIEVGKKRYWLGLAASVNFPGKTMEACLRVLHTDIVQVWNIPDDCGYLKSKELKTLMIALVGNQYDELSDPNKALGHAYSLLGALPKLIGGSAAHPAPIMLPFVASLFLVKWIYDVYDQSALMLQCFMAYIVDFTIIMQVIFGLVMNARLRLSRRLIKLAFKAYSISEERSRVHKEIKEHVKLAGRFDRDAALVKIVQLIKEYQMKPESMEELQSAVKVFENNEDEDWGLGTA